MCEISVSVYYTDVAEVKREIDERISRLIAELELRRLALNSEVDGFNLSIAGSDLRIQFDWTDSEIGGMIGSLGRVELVATEDTGPDVNSPLCSNEDILSSNTDRPSSGETGDSIELLKEDNLYMTMKRHEKKGDDVIATMRVPTNFGTGGEGGIDRLLSPGGKVSPLQTTYTYMEPIGGVKMKRSTSLRSFEQLRAMFEPNAKSKKSKKRQSENLETEFQTQQTEETTDSPFDAPCHSKAAPVRWKSEEVLTDPIYEVIDERVLKNMEGGLGKKRRFFKKGSEKTFDLPAVSRCTQGKRLGQLDKPKGVTISKGLLYVAEKGNNRIQVFNSDATHLFSFGENRMSGPYGVFVREDSVYVTLTNTHTLQMYTTQGVFVKQRVKEGREEGRLKLPTGIDGDTRRGKVYVCDTGNNRIQIFDKILKFIKVVRIEKLDKPLAIKVVRFEEFVVLDRSPVCLHFYNISGELLREMVDTRYHLKLINPLFFTISPQGHILVSDFSSHCIHVFGENGTLNWILGEAGKGKPLEEPRGIACDTRGRLVTVCNKKQDALQIFEL